MKKITKISLLTAAGFGVVGIALMISGAAMGASLPQMIRDNELSVYYMDGKVYTGWMQDTEHHGEHSAKTVAEAEAVKKLVVDVDMMSVTFQTISGHQITVEQNGNLNTVSATVENGVLTVEEQAVVGMVFGSSHATDVVIGIPEGKVFDSVEISVGAGKVDCIGTLNCNEAKLEVDAGSMTMNLSGFSILDADADMGQITLTLSDAGDICADTDAGSIILNMDGCDMDYNYDLDIERGSVAIDDMVYVDMGDALKVDNNIDKSMNLTCEMGNIQVAYSGYDADGVHHNHDDYCRTHTHHGTSDTTEDTYQYEHDDEDWHDDSEHDRNHH